MPAEQQDNQILKYGCLGAMALLGPIIVAFGISLLWEARRSWLVARQSTRWPTVLGTVTRSEFEAADPDASLAAVSLLFRYEYEVNGQHFASSSIAASGTIGPNTYEEAHAVLDPYPVGAQVVVFYNPRRPQESLLQPGIAGGQARAGLAQNIAWGVGIMVFGIVISLFMFYAFAKDAGWV